MAAELPHDVVETILCHVPVKSLLRFKSVCKSWYATISDERFAGLHLRQSRKNYSGHQDIFFWSEFKGYWWFKSKVNTEKLELFKKKTKFTSERKLDPDPLCYCDALALRRYVKSTYKNKYVLCNLCMGTYAELTCPYPIFYDTHTTLYGICYDPSINDYKVVIMDNKHYAVYQCRSKTWSEMKETTDDFSSSRVLLSKGVSLNGDLYLIIKNVEGCGRIKIVGFDCTSERFVKLAKPNYTTRTHLFMYLTCSEGHLFLCFDSGHYQKLKLGGGEEEESWTELIEGVPPQYERWKDTLLSSGPPEDETALDVWDDLCDSYVTHVMGYYRTPYLENLFIRGPERVIKKRRRRPI